MHNDEKVKYANDTLGNIIIDYKEGRLNGYSVVDALSELLQMIEEDEPTTIIIEPKLELAIISFEGSNGSYGHSVIDEANVRKAEDICIDEKSENDEYSCDTVVDRIEKAGIKVYSTNYHEFDFGM